MSFFIWSTCALLNCFLAIAVAIMMVSGESAYKFMGLNALIKRGSAHPLLIPNLIMFALLSILVLVAIYCFAAAGNIDLPYLGNVMIATTVLYLLRGAYIFIDPYIKPAAPTFALMSSYGALGIGAIQALAILYMYAFGS